MMMSCIQTIRGAARRATQPLWPWLGLALLLPALPVAAQTAPATACPAGSILPEQPQFNFDFANSTVVQTGAGGNNRAVGAIRRFHDVVPGVDALVQITTLSNATIAAPDSNLDQSSVSGIAAAFQPLVSLNIGATTGFAEFRITFVGSGSNTPIAPTDFLATAVDVDGDSGALREFAALASNGFVRSYVFAPTELTVAPVTINGESGLQFTGPVRTEPDILLSATTVRGTALFRAANSFTYRAGATANAIGGARQRQNSLFFGCVNYNSDFGDAPDGYHTTLSTGGPSHTAVAAAAISNIPAPRLGANAPDIDADGRPGANANGDDTNASDDEDGIAAFPLLSALGNSYSVTATCSPDNVTVAGWIDFDRSGGFDPFERAQAVCIGGSAQFDWDAANNNAPRFNRGAGVTYARFRIATDPTEINLPTGPAADGEVEDYRLDIVFNHGGTVYLDSNRNATLDSTETGTGQPLFVKLTTRTGSTCNGPATAAVPADPSTGAYRFNTIADGDFCLILDDNPTLTDITPGNPAGFVGTEAPDGIRLITVAGNPLPPQNFGLFQGSRLSGRVFQDTGVGAGGIANDGLQNGAEPGIGGVTVRAFSGTAEVATALTDASGDYTLPIPSTVTGQLRTVESNPTGFLSTGGQAGNTGGSYDRATDTTTFTFATGQVYTGVNFADVPVNQFLTDGNQQGLPGTTLFHTHRFTAGSGGSVVFATSAVASPAIPGWIETLYRDTDCNGLLDGTEGQTVLNDALAVSAGQEICLILREFIPGNAPFGAQNQVTVTAQFTYTNANPALTAALTRVDLTTVGTAGLSLIKSVDRDTARPGDVITYTIVFRNPTDQPLGNLAVFDATPAYTTLSEPILCPATLPADLTDCTVVEPAAGANAVGYVGSIEWRYTGTLRPGAEGNVVFRVQVQN